MARSNNCVRSLSCQKCPERKFVLRKGKGVSAQCMHALGNMRAVSCLSTKPSTRRKRTRQVQCGDCSIEFYDEQVFLQADRATRNLVHNCDGKECVSEKVIRLSSLSLNWRKHNAISQSRSACARHASPSTREQHDHDKSVEEGQCVGTSEVKNMSNLMFEHMTMRAFHKNEMEFVHEEQT